MLLLAGVLNGIVQAELYTWTDDQGNVHLSDIPPSDKKAQRFTIDKGCTIFKHVPGMTFKEYDLFVNKIFYSIIRREEVKGEYRELFDDITNTQRACDTGDEAACDCFHYGRGEIKGRAFAPAGTDHASKGKSAPMEGRRRTGAPVQASPQP